MYLIVREITTRSGVGQFRRVGFSCMMYVCLYNKSKHNIFSADVHYSF